MSKSLAIGRADYGSSVWAVVEKILVGGWGVGGMPFRKREERTYTKIYEFS